jgi:hypothetical protein
MGFDTHVPICRSKDSISRYHNSRTIKVQNFTEFVFVIGNSLLRLAPGLVNVLLLTRNGFHRKTRRLTQWTFKSIEKLNLAFVDVVTHRQTDLKDVLDARGPFKFLKKVEKMGYDVLAQHLVRNSKHGPFNSLENF